MTAPEPLAFPTDHDGWIAFVTDRPTQAVATVAEVDARLVAETDLDAAARLELWNDADLALRRAASEVSLLSESHPDTAVREAAEEQVQRLDAVASGRLLDRDLFTALQTVDTDAARADLGDDQRRLLAQALRDFRRGGVDLPDAERER
ncbi:MAG TPA: peptidase M3, partial [Microbacterium sp.]|nr:peptidase M3 [Microbacterium sp.]